jgi:pyridoxal phosphate enzyme (YggS family)
MRGIAAMLTSRDIAENLARIRERIARAAARAGRRGEDVTLVAVSKTQPAEAVLAALDAGQGVFGENRVQEAAEKFATVRAARPALRLHIIGALQTNKAREAVRIADTIESLDRPKLAASLAAAMRQEGRKPTLLVQVNTGEEPQKAGIRPAEAEAFLHACREEHGLAIEGLMCIPPAGDDPRPHFARLAGLAARHGLPLLSMGMSGDFEAAVELGATHIRVGSAIFGAR